MDVYVLRMSEVMHTYNVQLTVLVGLTGNGSVIGPQLFNGNINEQNYMDIINAHRRNMVRTIFRFSFLIVWWEKVMSKDGIRGHQT